jgi:hypothetical protein
MVEALCYKLEIAGSIPDEIIDFFNLSNPYSRTMVMGFAQPLTEISTKSF